MKIPIHVLKVNLLLCLFAGLNFFLSSCGKYQNDSDPEEGFFLFNGHVLEAGSGAPIKGATVIAYADESTIETERRTENAFGKTDSKGRFSMKVSWVPFGSYSRPFFCFYVDHPNYQKVEKGFYSSSGVKIYLTPIK